MSDIPLSLYTSSDGTVQLEVKFEGETVRLSQEQMIHVFGVSQSVISRHVNNVYKELGLHKKSNMQKMHIAFSDKPVVFYNLDIIIGVGYKVGSKQGNEFRIRATNVLKQYTLQGYAINKNRLNEQKLHELSQMMDIIKQTIHTNELSYDESSGLLEIITKYTQSRLLFYQYDTNTLPEPSETLAPQDHLFLAELAYHEIQLLKNKLIQNETASELFGSEKYQNSLEGIIGNIYQTRSGEELYPTRQSKAAHLLYFVVKDHPFNDGNKRIGAFLMILFLRNCNQLYDSQGTLKINDRALVAITLLIAQSNPIDKELMIQLVMNLVA